MNVSGRASPFSHYPALGRLVWRMRYSSLLAIMALATILVACTSNSSPTSRGSSAVPSSAVTSAPGSGPNSGACTLVSAADLHVLHVTGLGSASTVSVGTATTHGCTWGRPAAGELHIQYESLDPAAAAQVRESLGGHGAVVPGVGDGARGEFGSVLLAVNFFKGTTFVSMQLFGTGVGARKAAFLAVAEAVASRL